MEDLTRNRVVIFIYKEFEKFINEATYSIISITWDCSNGWFWLERDFSEDGEWEEWLEEYGEEAEKDYNSPYNDSEEAFIYRMVGKKLNGIVKTIVVDINSDKVVIVFE